MSNPGSDSVEQLFTQALAHHQAGRLGEAEALYRRILSQWPGHAGAWHAMGVLAGQVGQPEVALGFFRNALTLLPDQPVFLSNLGETLRQLKRYQEGEAALRRAVAVNPQLADGYCNLAVLLLEVNRPEDARALLVVATAQVPGHAGCWRMLADALVRLGHNAEAIPAFQTALRLNPDFAEARFNFASALAKLGRPQEALVELERLLPAAPKDAQTRYLYAEVLAQCGKLQEAVDQFQESIRLNPSLAAAHGGLANSLRTGDRLDEAIAAYRRAVALEPGDVATRGNMAFALRDQARLAEAIAEFRAALEISPNHAAVHSAMIFTMHLDLTVEPEAIAAEKRLWSDRHETPFTGPQPPHERERSPERRLRVGYVSADLRSHPVGRFMEPLLCHHDRSQVEVYGYSGVMHPDAMTESLRAACDHWRNLAAVPDEAAEAMIRADRIDILVDLHNHTTGNRLTLFARRPAPVQLTYLAYGAGTGLGAMDWRLTDPHIDPPELETPAALELVGERPLRMAETFWCYAPHEGTPEVSPLPALVSGHFTFGSMNFFSKLNDQVLALWARLLGELPGSHLIMHVPAGSRQPHVREFFRARGVAPERLTLLARMSPQEYFSRYREMDVALDPFPWAGGTTTCDALFMGVPVLTLAGVKAEETLSRGGASLLSNLGLHDWIAHSPEEYLGQARRATQDLPALAALRAELRGRMQRSVLMDAKRFARHVEEAFRRAWRDYLAGEHGGKIN